MLNLNRLKAIEDEWEIIESSYQTEPFNSPVNFKNEYQKTLKAFTNHNEYNPQFKYLIAENFPLQKITRFISRLKPEQSQIEQIYYAKAQCEILTIQSVQTHDKDLITSMACFAYGLSDANLVKNAYDLLNNIPPVETPQNRIFTAGLVNKIMQFILKEANLDDWESVVFHPMNAQISVNNIIKKIKVRKDVRLSQEDIVRLLIHEIGVHILRFENGKNQPIQLFKNGFFRYLNTEEGLAVFCEEKYGVIDNNTLRKYAGRVIAAQLALNHSFFEVLKTLTTYFDFETSFNIVMRAKRGFIDTAQPGANTKDIVYLDGFLKVKEYAKLHPQNIPTLFAGKIGIENIDLIISLLEEKIITPPKLDSDVFAERLINAFNIWLSHNKSLDIQ